jgi:hypothetical protein
LYNVYIKVQFYIFFIYYLTVPEGKRPLGRPRRRWDDNIKMDLQEVRGYVGTAWSWLRIRTGGGHL